MARIYINYSRADTSLVEQLVPLLEHAFPDDTVWYDRDSSTRADWSQQILSEIERCDLFIYLISNESLTAKQCQDEFYEALRLQKICLSIIIRPATDVTLAPPELRQLNWIDMSSGFQDAKANVRLIRSVMSARSLPTASRLQINPANLPAGSQSPTITAPKRTNRRRFWISTAGGLVVIAALVVTFLFLSIAREPVVGNIFSSTVSLLGGTRTASSALHATTTPREATTFNPPPSELPSPQPTATRETNIVALALTDSANSTSIAAMSSPLPPPASDIPSTQPPPTETQESTRDTNTTATAFALTSDANSTLNAAISSPPPATLTEIALLVTTTFTVDDAAGKQIGSGQVRVRAPSEMALNGTGNIEVEIEIDPQALPGNATFRPANTAEPLLNTPPPSPSPVPTIPGNPFFLSIYEYMGVELQSARLSRFDLVAIPPAAPPPYDVRHFQAPGVVDVWKWQISPHADAVGNNPFVLSIYARKDPFSSQYANVIIKTIDLPIRVIDPGQANTGPSVGNNPQTTSPDSNVPIVLIGVGIVALVVVVGVVLRSRRRVAHKWGANRVFISYRRVDSAEVVGRIYDRLAEHFGKDAIFKDVNSIYPGENFKVKISDSVAQCTVLLAIIGDQWLIIKDEKGNRRLDNPDDFVRLEIESALERKNISVIPLTVRGAQVPEAKDLPPSLSQLVFKNALPIRPDPDFDNDIARLITALEKALATSR